MNNIRNYFEEGKAYLGKDIKEVVLNNLDSLECRSIMVNYIKPVKEDHTKISDYNYYTIEINDFNKIYLKRYRDNSLCEKDDIPVINEELKSIINNTSLLGKDIINLCNKEVLDDNVSEEFKEFYFNILTNKKFCPNINNEYFLYCNSSKQFYLKKVLKDEEEVNE